MADTIGTAVIKLRADAKQLKTDIKAAEKDVEAGASKASSILGVAAGTVGTIVGTVAAESVAAVTAITTASVKAYGEFEQLSGGMKKIFDEVDYNQIEQDALEAYKNMNLSANDYMKNIAGVGATLAATLGDQKGYDTAKKGMQAISDWASGTGVSIDTLMSKYQLITRNAQQYQVIADQFAGILPQTSKDFLAQAQAAGYLSEEYTQLTQVPVAEYQEAVTAMLEKGVADAGLLGNTAAETANTITGSMAGAKASIQNLLVGLANPEADIGALVENVVETVGDFAKNLGKVIVRILPNVVTAIGTLVDEIMKALPEILTNALPTFLQAIIDVFVILMNSLGELWDPLWQGVLTLVDMIAQNLPAIIGSIVNMIIGLLLAIAKPENIRLLLVAAIDLLSGIIGAIPVILNALVEALPDIILAIVQFFSDPATIEQLCLAFAQLLMALVTVVPSLLSGLFNAFVELFTGLWETLKGKFTEFAASFGKGIGNAIIDGLNAMIGFVEGVLNGPINLINSVLDDLNKLPGINIEHLSTITLSRIQPLATGGVATGPVNALIGEAGKEAVIPLEQNTDWARIMARELDEQFDEEGVGGRTINIYMTNEINNKLDINEVSQELVTSIRRAI